MKRLLVIAILFPVLAFGQWSPCWTNGDQYHWYNAGNEVLSAAVERASVSAWGLSGITLPDYASRFLQRSKLVAAKRAITNCFNSSGYAFFAGWVDMASDMTDDDLPLLTSSQVLARAGAPADYFDSTPFFHLQSSSNGWRFFPAICSQLVATVYEDFFVNQSFDTWMGAAYGYANYAAAKAQAEVDWHYAGDQFYSVGKWSRSWIESGQYNAFLVDNYAWDILSLPNTGITYSADVFLSVGFDGLDFDPQGYNVSTNLSFYTNIVDSGNFLLEIGNPSTNSAAKPSWGTDGTSFGWSENTKTRIRFNYEVTNGFRYK